MKELQKTSTVTTLDTEQLRQAMRAWTTGVAIVTSTLNGNRHGMTMSSFTSISLNPALVIMSLQGNTRTHELVVQSGVFGITILSKEQIHISDRFAGRTHEIDDRFAGLDLETLVTGAPLIKGGLAWLDCRIVESYDAGMNTLFIGEVVAACNASEGLPLVYHKRKYWNLSP
jgi:flavin reductase (DIM6/NTAB) family NADH-FMN oxidoreductase RutF